MNIQPMITRRQWQMLRITVGVSVAMLMISGVERGFHGPSVHRKRIASYCIRNAHSLVTDNLPSAQVLASAKQCDDSSDLLGRLGVPNVRFRGYSTETWFYRCNDGRCVLVGLSKSTGKIRGEPAVTVAADDIRP